MFDKKQIFVSAAMLALFELVTIAIVAASR
jgi:hypothetical protein